MKLHLTFNKALVLFGLGLYSCLALIGVSVVVFLPQVTVAESVLADPTSDFSNLSLNVLFLVLMLAPVKGIFFGYIFHRAWLRKDKQKEAQIKVISQ